MTNRASLFVPLASNGGLVMVTFYNYFLKCGPRASVSDVADHIMYIRSLIGVDHIGVGGDFDGINRTPRGLEDVSMYPELFSELLRHGAWTEEDLAKVAGRNLLRVFKAVEKVRDEMKLAGIPPSEEHMEQEPGPSLPCSYDMSQFDHDMEV